ncbi:MAG TPA: hypothetical protein DEO38_05575 [Bacteroidales bacterium]|nr:hypothetical protein [Bacteroidales bacterium]
MFALAHMNDDVPLSILTILLIVLVADQYGFPLEVSTALALLFCIAGFFIGTKGAELINMIFNFEEKTITNIIMTFVTTEILGWSTYFIVKNRPDDNITK